MSRSRKSVRQCGLDGGGIAGRATSIEGLPEIAVVTKLRSQPHKLFSRELPRKSERLPISPVKMLAGREANHTGRSKFTSSDRCHLSSRYLPVKGPSLIDRMDSCAYVSQFSADGTLFVAGFQDSDIKIYSVDNDWKVKKNIRARSLRWTITDASLSPDQRFLVYSSMSPIVHIVNIGSSMTESVANITEIHDGLDFSGHDDEDVDIHDGYSFGIFSVKFSTDGRELVAASSDDSIYVYDLVANKLNVRIPAHRSDVNTVCFADEAGHVLYSGSDDHLCKVWDRRCLGTRGKESGVLAGHLEGITFIDSHGDGKHFISNGKDQSIKLWDIRKMSSNARGFTTPRHVEWDYRWMEYPSHLRNRKHPNDQSLATYRGHRVLRTLIRCYFSPSYSTGQKYIYTGSADAHIYIYDVVTGDLVAKLKFHDQIVRDCSWHPFNPMLGSSSWDGVIANWELSGTKDSIAR